MLQSENFKKVNSYNRGPCYNLKILGSGLPTQSAKLREYYKLQHEHKTKTPTMSGHNQRVDDCILIAGEFLLNIQRLLSEEVNEKDKQLNLDQLREVQEQQSALLERLQKGTHVLDVLWRHDFTEMLLHHTRKMITIQWTQLTRSVHKLT